MKNRPKGVFYPGDLVSVRADVRSYTHIDVSPNRPRQTPRGKLHLTSQTDESIFVPQGYELTPSEPTVGVVLAAVTGKSRMFDGRTTELKMWLYVIATRPSFQNWISAANAKLVLPCTSFSRTAGWYGLDE